MTVLGLIVLFLGLVAAGAGAGLALFERIPPRGSLRLMGLGTILAVVGLLITILTADRGERLQAGTIVPLVIVVAIVAYAAWFARRAQAGDGALAGRPEAGDGASAGRPTRRARVTPRARRRARRRR